MRKEKSKSKVKTVLIIEDNQVVRDIIIEITSSMGFDYIHTSNGSDGLKHVINHPIDLIITDMGLPGLTGEKLIEKIRKKRINIPVLMIGGVDVDKSAAQWQNWVHFMFAQKPFDIKSVKAKIMALMEAGQKDSNLHRSFV